MKKRFLVALMVIVAIAVSFGVASGYAEDKPLTFEDFRYTELKDFIAEFGEPDSREYAPMDLARTPADMDGEVVYGNIILYTAVRGDVRRPNDEPREIIISTEDVPAFDAWVQENIVK